MWPANGLYSVLGHYAECTRKCNRLNEIKTIQGQKQKKTEKNI